MFELRNSFPGQKSNEAIFVFARPYLLAFLPTSVIFLLIFLAQVTLQYAAYTNLLLLTSLGRTILVLSLGVTELFTIVVYAVALFDFYFDILIVSDRKVVDIDQEQLFYRQISELNLEDVEDVKSVTKGIFQTFFDFGTVTVQTAGEQNNFIMYNYRHPRQIASIISDLSEQAKREIPESQRQPKGDTLAVINGEKIDSHADLIEAGAIEAEDVRTDINKSTTLEKHW